MRRSVRWLLLDVAVGVALGLLFGWLAVRGLDWPAVFAAFRHARLPVLLAGMCLVALLGLVRAVRWRLLMPGRRVTVWRLYLVEQIGLGANIVSPISGVGEPLELALLISRDRVPSAEVLASLTLQRLADFIITVAIVLTGLLFVPQLRPIGTYAAIALMLSASLLVALLLLVPLVDTIPFLRRFALVGRYAGALRRMVRMKRRLALAVGLTAAHWLAVGGIGWLVTQAFGLGLPFLGALVVSLAVLTFSTWAPDLPGGFGPFELAGVHLLEQWGIPKEAAFAATLGLHAALFLPPMLFALAALPIEGVRSVEALAALIRRSRQDMSKGRAQ